MNICLTTKESINLIVETFKVEEHDCSISLLKRNSTNLFVGALAKLGRDTNINLI